MLLNIRKRALYCGKNEFEIRALLVKTLIFVKFLFLAHWTLISLVQPMAKFERVEATLALKCVSQTPTFNLSRHMHM